jgi:hypothetical protein
MYYEESVGNAFHFYTNAKSQPSFVTQTLNQNSHGSRL